MRHERRFQAAQQTALATTALMRKLNPKNNVYLSAFSDSLREISSLQLKKNVSPGGGTRTDYALKWLREKLEDSGPSIAYLITDGRPEWHGDDNDLVDMCVEEAKKFANNPYLMLRIFLIDGNEGTEKIIRRIGAAAGKSTKVIPVKNYEFSNGMIKDIANVINQMYAIEEF